MRQARRENLAAQYGTSEPLQVRIETHRRYEERAVDLDEVAARVLPLSHRDSILDTGCGPGAFLRFLHEHGHQGRLLGVDLSPGMANSARARLPMAGVVVGSVEKLPFCSGQFHWCVARHMLYHVPDIELALGELVRVASKGVLVSTGSRSSMPHLEALLNGTVAEFGIEQETPEMARFCIENAAQHLEGLGLPFEEFLIDNALVFDTSAPMVRYALSCLPSFGLVPGDSRYEEAREILTTRAADLLQQHGGVVRDPKQVAFCLVRLE